MKDNKYLIMSIKTKYANKIFSGIKRFEYRTKSISENNLNKYCLIYSSEVDRSIIGYVIFDYIIEGNFEYLVKNTNPENPLGLKKYLAGREKGYALHVKEHKKFDQPIKLELLKSINKKFNIPQYYRYIKEDEYLYSIIDNNYLKERNYD